MPFGGRFGSVGGKRCIRPLPTSGTLGLSGWNER
ncbi:hypothetical protein BBOH_1254 [Bifidobacterium bohemicum DSM 22767]|uniref:Uncharacterized protein n=1 Tax=Bifidobacterium bohemicum DSM 22767 TaxID=1437606 RepID=A0A086ZEP4_9BIFI|nr:hypothetical protein BBOH_1254 [Bifidobacterium bohemicum DSM 22767]